MADDADILNLEKAAESMMLIVNGNNQRLSDTADNKAHILITVTSILLSVVISLVLKQMDTDKYLILPTFIMSSVCLSTMIFAILATRPTIPKGKTAHKKLKEHKANILFFGNYYKMEVGDYCDRMIEVMTDNKMLYRMLLKDVFFQGVILAKKYRLLRIAYNIFMFGLILSVIVYFLAAVLGDRSHKKMTRIEQQQPPSGHRYAQTTRLTL